VLFHVSEESSIRRFEPRLTTSPEPLVWAIHADRLCNYLLPRDCPRVTYYAGPESAQADVSRFEATTAGTIAVEQGWLDRIRSTRLFLYRLPDASFENIDATAGYFVSRSPVEPLSEEAMDDAPAAIAARGARLVALPSLWQLHDDVAASSLGFSMIRMRSATPR
jgi:hypothetical protein